jgi:2-isopropylmalate synthase
MTYAIMTPQSIGLGEHQMVLGKHSGRHALRAKIKELGYDLEEKKILEVFGKFKALADKKKNIYDDDLHALIAGSVKMPEEKYELGEVEISSGTHRTPHARVQIIVEGELKEGTGKGDGPVDAVFSVIRSLTGFTGRLNRFAINAVTGGADAQGEVVVAVEKEGRIVRGIGSHTDIVIASAMAYVNALNRLESSERDVTVHM